MSAGLQELLKRTVDLAIAAAASVVLAPVLALVALLVRLKLGGPVLFRQARIGKDERRFELIKFRTMRSGVGPDGRPLPDEERLTPFGRRLRSSSLDELPELWNILRGDMSLVGPRPLLVEYVPCYTARERLRHAVRPGLTGLAQVRGRNAVGWRHKLRYDVFYVEHRSLGLDLWILMQTALVVLQRRGISAPGSATMPRLDDERRRRSDPGSPGSQAPAATGEPGSGLSPSSCAPGGRRPVAWSPVDPRVEPSVSPSFGRKQ